MATGGLIMSTWRLNTFLTTWRTSVNKHYPRRTKLSDGTIGDTAHQAESSSEHNPDPDGSVDAWDCDVNLLGSSNPLGSTLEVAAMRGLLAEFQKQPQAQLWIFQRKIANRDVGNWKIRVYTGPSPHDHHCHFQSRQSQETRPYTGEVVPAMNSKPSAAKLGTRVLKLGMSGADVAYLQRWLGLDADGVFGPATLAKVLAYQKMRGIAADGVVGKGTWSQMGIK
jgi:hypothetical protein